MGGGVLWLERQQNVTSMTTMGHTIIFHR
jgi:hypothetical protein